MSDRIAPGVDRIAVLALFVAVAGVIASYLQYMASERSISLSRQIANEQLRFAQKAVEDGNRDTQEALALTRKLVGSASALAVSGDKQVLQAQRLADVSSQSSQTAIDALDESTGNFRRQLRAYVEVQFKPGFTTPTIDTPLLPIMYSNFGSSPAYQVRPLVRWWFQKTGESIPGPYEAAKDHPWYATRKFRLSRENIANLRFEKDEVINFLEMKKNDRSFVYQVIVDYLDVYGEEHRTSYCAVINDHSFSECGWDDDSS